MEIPRMSKSSPSIGDKVCVVNAKSVQGTITEVEFDSGNHVVKVSWEDGKFPNEWWGYEKELSFVSSK